MLLDTQVVLWLLDDSPRLGSSTRRAIDTAAVVHVSAVSLWEVAIKSRLGKLTVPGDLPDRVEAAGLAWLDLSPRHAWSSADVTLPHRDPFDRMLVAQATCERLALVTADRVLLAEAGVDVVDARS